MRGEKLSGTAPPCPSCRETMRPDVEGTGPVAVPLFRCPRCGDVSRREWSYAELREAT